MSTAGQTPGTVIPRWTQPGASTTPDWAHTTAALPSDLSAGLDRLAGALGVDLPVLLTAAHLKVLSAITSERTVVTGLRTADRSGHCAATLPAGTWRDLVTEAARTTDALDSTPRADTEITLDIDLPHRGSDPLTPTVVLAAHYGTAGAEVALRLRYRTDAFDADFAGRVVGYHLAALRAMVADPDRPHDDAGLLDRAELSRQFDELSGERRPLPGPLFVELFERQVAGRPDALAAAHNSTQWSFSELNVRANQIAHALRAHGLRDEGVVAVVMERNLDWLAATLGVLKAGGVYLPVRPDFPADRVATQLSRSACEFAVTEPGSEETLRAAYAKLDRPGVALRVEEVYSGSGPTTNPDLPIEPGQLAYIYFTSGSTGAPKGAMCEHAGMLNHLFMKVDDMRLAAGDTVTQTASQCFDISLWQLLAPLLVGGSTTIVDTEAQLDVDRFIDQIGTGGIEVIQIVPAYLDVMLSHLERDPRPLGDLRSVSVTGEALKLGLVRRWFALHPDIALVNAYGATEVSDDTMHAVLTRVPERDLAIVPVGRSLRNVNTYILDGQLRLVPLGAPGEIAFSGVCVGRGYINDPERTAQAFTTDPHRPGERLYRTGDFGRWLPEGTIEFLGRRDEQIKIRGYRIEIGEIESRLLQMPGVREAAVVIAGDSDQTKNLVAFFTGESGVQSADLRDFLAAALPEYMLPSYFHRRDALPLSENGKVNKKLLTGLAATLGRDAPAYLPPASTTERRLATAWAEVLNVLVGRIGRFDNFFSLGGTSLAAVRLVVKLDRLVSLRQLVANPVLADLAASVDGGSAGDRPAGVRETVLQRLSSVDGRPLATLVCFPYAGGNAVNFQSLARELAGSGIAVLGVELPGHDVARPDEELVDVAEVARRVRDELATLDEPGELLLWGHCAGAAYAVELARLLERGDRPAARLFVGAMMLDEPDALNQESAEVSGLTNREITDRLHQDSAYIELDVMKSERADLLGRAYRHDVCSTNDYLLSLQAVPGRRLRTAVDVVVAADDPTTVDAPRRHRRWELVAEAVVFASLDAGGHYFIRSQVRAVADRIRAAAPAAAGQRT